MPRIIGRCLALLAILFLTTLDPTAHAQTPIIEEPGYTPTLVFDTAVIRPEPPGGPVHVTVSSPPRSSRFEVKSLPLKAIVQIAYGFDAPVVGIPDWATNVFYDITARSDEQTDARLTKLTDNQVRLEKRHAIRILLAERLSLKTHFETRPSSVYNLVVAKGGVKMTPVPAPPSTPDSPAPPTPPPVSVAAKGGAQGLQFDGASANMRAIAGTLSSMVEAPVVDKTGLTGLYGFTLQFGREWSEHNPESWPPIFTAVQEQLGLKLESVRESVPNLVIDHIDKPSEN